MYDNNINKRKKTIKINNKKRRIQRNRRILFSSILSLIILIFLGIIVRNLYITNRCSNLIYAIDHYFTSYSDKDLRLIKVESISIISKTNNEIEIEASGFSYKKPYNKTTLIGRFTQNSHGQWVIQSIIKGGQNDDENSKTTKSILDNN